MKVLLIEYEPAVANVIKRGLAAEMCLVEIAVSGKEGLTCARLNEYDVVVIDAALQDMEIYTIVSLIRSCKPCIPILVLSTEKDIEAKVTLLSICDDYVTKPCCMREVAARLRALTRRGTVVHSEILTIGSLTLDSCRYTVDIDGLPVYLRNKEFALLEYLMRNQDIVLSREVILSHVWDAHADPFTNTVDTHIRLLRKKLETPDRIFIHTVPKRGYRFSLRTYS